MKKLILSLVAVALAGCGKAHVEDLGEDPLTEHDAGTTTADAGVPISPPPPPPPDAGTPHDAGELVACGIFGAACTEAPCCGGFYCDDSPYSYTAGFCRPLHEDGEFCMNAGECLSNNCTDNLCGGLVCANPGEECYGPENPCCGGFICELDPNRYGVGHCIPPRTEGEFCIGHEECASGNCFENMCIERSEFSFQRVYQEVFAAHGCTNNACHGAAAGGLPLRDPNTTYTNLVYVTATGVDCDRATRVTPWAPEESLLLRKVDPRVPSCGMKMPPTTMGLPDEAIELLRSWILAGAPR